MKSVGIRALKQNASAVLRDVADGDEITITDRGRPVARIIPIASSRIESLVESGRVRPARRSLVDLGPPLDPEPGATPLSEVVRAARDDERY